jgi:curved DNA-binding protein CbpA
MDRLDEAEANEESAEDIRGACDAADPYATLGVRPDLSSEELKNVYRLLAQIYHPDKGRVADHRRFQEIQHAWQMICAERGI